MAERRKSYHGSSSPQRPHSPVCLIHRSAAARCNTFVFSFTDDASDMFNQLFTHPKEY